MYACWPIPSIEMFQLQWHKLKEIILYYYRVPGKENIHKFDYISKAVCYYTYVLFLEWLHLWVMYDIYTHKAIPSRELISWVCKHPMIAKDRYRGLHVQHAKLIAAVWDPIIKTNAVRRVNLVVHVEYKVQLCNTTLVIIRGSLYQVRFKF